MEKSADLAAGRYISVLLFSDGANFWSAPVLLEPVLSAPLSIADVYSVISAVYFVPLIQYRI